MRSARLAALVACVVAGATASAVGARPISTAVLLKTARQMILVTTPDWNAVGGTLYAFERGVDGGWAPARWRASGPRADAASGISIVVGTNGTAWDPGLATPVKGPVKTEGDGRSPAGVFALGTAFGFARPAETKWLTLPYAEVTPALECVDDPASRHYNTLVERPSVDVDWKSSEKMRDESPWYHWGVVVEFNTRPVVPRRGSCIFLHVGGDGGRGTAGCTAMAEPALKTLMAWLDPAQAPVLVQLPLDAYGALRTAWALPALPAGR